MLCNEFLRLVQTQIVGPAEDVVGLFEQFWALPDGPEFDIILGYSKRYKLETVADLNSSLIRKGFLRLMYVSDGLEIPQVSVNSVYNKENWKPFQLSDGPGYALIATERGERLAAALTRKFGLPGMCLD